MSCGEQPEHTPAQHTPVKMAVDTPVQKFSSPRHSKSVEECYESAYYAAKYKNYERDYLRRITHRYFSDQALGTTEPVFDNTSMLDSFIIKETRENPVNKFLDSKSLEANEISAAAPSSSSRKAATPSKRPAAD